MTILYQFDMKSAPCGDVAQLGERGVRNAEVRGSIPLISTKLNCHNVSNINESYYLIISMMSTGILQKKRLAPLSNRPAVLII